jgi:hypothetical protein
MNKATIIRPEGLADNEDLHQVICAGCGYEGHPSSDRAALISERNMHACPAPTPKERKRSKRAPKTTRRPSKKPHGRRRR